MTAAKILRFQLRDLSRSPWVVGYALLLLALTEALLRLGGGPRAALSLMNVVLTVVPLVSVVFGTMYLYGAREFIELLLAQPVGRRTLYAGLYGGVALPLVAGFLLGVGLPFLWTGTGDSSAAGPIVLLLGCGTLLTLTFTAIAFLVSLLVTDRARGLGAAILLWLGATVIYDAILVLAATALSDYPLELPLLGLTLLNPVDLGRVLLLLQFDIAALMGYTGAVFERFFGSGLGLGITGWALVLWTAVPFLLGMRRFARKDF
jgi:Cu-processing system permease protein